MCDSDDNCVILPLGLQDSARAFMLKATGDSTIPPTTSRLISVQEYTDALSNFYRTQCEPGRHIGELRVKKRPHGFQALLVTVTSLPSSPLTLSQCHTIVAQLRSNLSLIKSRYTVELTKAGVPHIHLVLHTSKDVKITKAILRDKSLCLKKFAGNFDIKFQQPQEDPDWAYKCMSEYFDKEEKVFIFREK